MIVVNRTLAIASTTCLTGTASGQCVNASYIVTMYFIPFVVVGSSPLMSTYTTSNGCLALIVCIAPACTGLGPFRALHCQHCLTNFFTSLRIAFHQKRLDNFPYVL